MKSLATLFAIMAMLFAHRPAEAQFGKLIREGAEYLGKQARKAMTEGAESGAQKLGSVADDVAGKSASKIVRTGSAEAGQQAVVQSGKTLAVVGKNAADEILANLGPAGVQSMGALSPVGASRLAEVSAELAKNPHRTEWLRLIRESGDAVATFLWERKLSVGVAVAASAAMLAPSDFIRASEAVVTSTVSMTGEHLIEPLITQTAQQVAGPVSQEISRQAASHFPWTLFYCLMFLGISGIAGYLYLRWK
ncbi:MAG: hypothetical protein ACK526_13380 [Planctomyces sp.]